MAIKYNEYNHFHLLIPCLKREMWSKRHFGKFKLALNTTSLPQQRIVGMAQLVKCYKIFWVYILYPISTFYSSSLGFNKNGLIVLVK